jgi:arginase
MTDQRIISPTFLERHVPGLAELARPADLLIAATPAGGSDIERLKPIHQDLAEQVERVAKRGQRPVVVMGDCCQTIPILAGLQNAGIHPMLIWLDAHGDFNTPETTPSGFLGGMPLAMITGRGDLGLNRQVGMSTLADDEVVLSDARDLDPGERELVEGSKIRHIKDVGRLLYETLPAGPIYVHFDSDIISSDDAPAFHYPVKGGPSAQKMTDVLAHLGRSGQVIAASMTAWAPELDKDGQAAKKCLAAFAALTGSA